MKIILDTNVIISGIFFTGPPYLILDAWRNGRLSIVLSPEIFREYQRVATILNHKYPIVNINLILDLIANKAEFITPDLFQSQICDDPDDDKFFECAITSDAKIIISGDKHLLDVSGFKNIIVLKPNEFVEKYL